MANEQLPKHILDMRASLGLTTNPKPKAKKSRARPRSRPLFTRRERGLHTLQQEVAIHGEVTKEALEAWLDSRASRKVYRETVEAGMRQFLASKASREGEK